MTTVGRGKVTARLREDLAAAESDAPVDVVIEMEHPAGIPSGTRKQRLDAARSGFEKTSESIVHLITAAGGEVLGTAWINSTVRGRVPSTLVPTLAQVEAVRLVDAPQPLHRETSG